MKSTLLFAFWLTGSLSLYAQTFDAQTTTQGVLKTTEGKYQGAVDVNTELDQVMWTSGNTTRIFGARQIKEVTISMENGQSKKYKGAEFDGGHYLFEVIAEGNTNILFRPKILKDSFTNTYYPDYFTLKKQQIIPLEKKKDFLALFGNDASWMHQFIKNQDIDLKVRDDVSEAYQYYNQTFEAATDFY